MSHPPIPPNCDFFVSSECGDTMNFTSPDDGGDYDYWCLCHAKGERRSIIAAVARCAWLDESERITSACGGDPFDTGVFDEVGDEYSTAIKNAESWRLWSLGQYGQELSEKTP